MFVPSLSWQMIIFLSKSGPKTPCDYYLAQSARAVAHRRGALCEQPAAVKVASTLESDGAGILRRVCEVVVVLNAAHRPAANRTTQHTE